MLFRPLQLFLLVMIGCGCFQHEGDHLSQFPKTVSAIIHYLDSNKIKEYDSVWFYRTKFNSYKWRFVHSGLVALEYSIGYSARIANPPNPKDSVERLEVSDTAYFFQMFPTCITSLPSGFEMLRQRDGTITIKTTWGEEVVNNPKVYYSKLKPEALFKSQNAFDYFRKRNYTMDSVGIYSIGTWYNSSCVLVTLQSRNEFLFYRPDRAREDSLIRRELDSIFTTGKKVDALWTYVYKPSLKN